MLGLRLFKVIIICAFTVKAFEFEDALNFLDTYGYFNNSGELNYETISETNNKYIQALKYFQTQYELPVDGTLNFETINLMNTERCGVSDNLNYAVSAQKWFNKTVTWNVYRIKDNKIIILLDKAFNVWSQYADITFVRSYNNPNILITIGKHRHFYSKIPSFCPTPFDGPGNVLAHATMPTYQQTPTEIHFDADEPWSYELDTIEGSTNFLKVAIHEIGHAIGIQHSFYKKSIMNAFLKTNVLVHNNSQIELYDDDKKAIQQLYGIRRTPTTLETKKPTVPTTSAASSEKILINTPNICDVNKELNTFLIINEHLYIIYKQWIWQKSLLYDDTFDYKPTLLSNWFPFLKNNNVLAVYQRPNGNIIVIADKVYNIKFPSLQIENYVNFGPMLNITSAFNSYKGHT